MKGILTASAFWSESTRRWKCSPMKDGVRKSFYCSTPGRRGKALCEAKAQEWIEKYDFHDPRFDGAWEEFIAYRRRTVGTSQYSNDESIGRAWLLPALASKKVSRITNQDCQNILLDAAEKGRAKKTIKDIKVTIGSFYSFCKNNRYDFEKPDLIVPEAKSCTKKVISPADVAKIFASTDPDPNLRAYQFDIVLGLRRGELVGMQWDDIQDGILSIKRSINRFGEITSGKNANARRSIKLPKIAARILDEQKKLSGGSIWVFPDEETGDFLHPNRMYDSWSSFCQRNSIPHISFHEIRHTMISMNRNTMSLELLKMVVGHSSSMDTFGVYGHEVEGDKEAAAAVIDDLMDSVVKSGVR